ncbi:hypothetical protein ASH00_09040 [Arthrobacter sp. Soil782]|uniref:hypothetical protein n=1 Tax=Arthrobacter sp. Soil782 TaxID=1736410 RepID=UPI0006FCA0CF|nr:hypothetical protein [Arthrobacter sp. Soil782]KRF05602.1 hypothetical protein ASH00_09040 [Arthrobacter sp. Soil782]
MSAPTLTLVSTLTQAQIDAEAEAWDKSEYLDELENDYDRADIAVAEFVQLDLTAQFVAHTQSFGALTESLHNEDITDRTPEMATLLQEKSTAFMAAALARPDDSEIDDYEVRIGKRIATAAAYAVQAFRGETAPNAGDLLCLLMSTVAGQGDNGPSRNRKIAVEMTEGFTIFCVYEPANPSWGKRPVTPLSIAA